MKSTISSNKKTAKLTVAILTAIATMGSSYSAFAATNDKTNLDTFTFEPMVVTASRIPESITEAKADISVVSRDEIEKMHMSTVEEALRTVPGVQFLNYGTNGLNANLSGIRINGSKDVVILVDGVRITDFQGPNNAGYAYTSLLSNMDNIERIEILRGAASTSYGNGAKGGVINIITREITGNKSTIDISNGSFGKDSFKFSTQGKEGKFGYHVYHNRSFIGDTKDGNGDTWVGHTNSKNTGTKFTYDFDDKNKLTINYDKTDTRYSGMDYIYKGPFEGYYKSDSITLKHDYTMNDKWSNTFVYRHNKIKTSYGKPEGEGTPGGRASTPYSVTSDYTYNFISDQVNFNDGVHNIILGLDYSKGHNNALRRAGYDQDGNIIKANRWLENYSYFIQDDWKFAPNWTLSGGIRYDMPNGDKYSPEYDHHTSKSYKLSYDITENDSIYAGRSDYYILPSLEQISDPKYGNAKLAPAYGRTTSIGYNKKFDDYNIFTLNWFKTEADRGIGYDGDGQYQNYDGGIARGWNAQYLSQLGEHWNLNLGWSHLYEYTPGDKNYAMGYSPKDVATFGVYYDYKKVNAGLDGFYFMRRVNPNFKDGWPKDNYGVYNLSVNYAPTEDMTFYFKVENLFDTLWAEHTDVIWNGNPNAWYSMPGRTFILGMQYNF